MTLWIDHTQHEEKVAADLRRICSDRGMVIELVDPTDRKKHSGRVRYETRTVKSVGCKMIADLVDLPQPVYVAGKDPGFIVIKMNILNGVPETKLREVQGYTAFKTSPGVEPLPIWAAITYDPTDDNGSGYWVWDAAQEDTKMASPSHVILYHELAHARCVYQKQLLGTSGTAMQRKAEELAVAEENAYLKSLGKHERLGSDGGTGFRASDGCFVATAAYGSALSPHVQALRSFRDDVLLSTHSATRFFDEFYGEYYRISPAIADLMREDRRLAELMRSGLVQPLLNYLQLARRVPLAETATLPEPWREFVETLLGDMHAWLAAMPWPDHFQGYSETQKLDEIAGLLRTVARDRATRSGLLKRLESSGEIPLRLEEGEMTGAAALLRADGCLADEIARILGCARATAQSPTPTLRGTSP